MAVVERRELTPMDVTPKACPYCGDQFTPRSPGGNRGGRPQVYCSSLCRRRYWRLYHPQTEADLKRSRVWHKKHLEWCAAYQRAYRARLKAKAAA